MNHNFGWIKIHSYNTFLIQNILTFDNVITLIKAVVIKNKIKYYYHIFFRKRFVQR